jgi:cytidine deaminase
MTDGRTDPPAPLAEAARRAARLAGRLSPRRPRGAALLTQSGRIFAAPEVEDTENVGVGVCAERAVLYQALLAGNRRFRALVLRSARAGQDPGPPCGACLQVLLEFSPGLLIYWGTRAHPQGGIRVRELLPGAFGPDHLKRRIRAGRARRPGKGK